uniref:RNA-directed DNA polymerase from mobile element jockey n=1 Tax=Heterorhabditis bacteriophora TaxID=37862 RepID=A0A1I7WV88_HETBA
MLEIMEQLELESMGFPGKSCISELEHNHSKCTTGIYPGILQSKKDKVRKEDVLNVLKIRYRTLCIFRKNGAIRRTGSSNGPTANTVCNYLGDAQHIRKVAEDAKLTQSPLLGSTGHLIRSSILIALLVGIFTTVY